MAIIILILGTIIVRVMASIFANISPIIRIILSTVIGVGIGFWAINTPWASDDEDGILFIIDTLLKVPMMFGVGIAMILVTIGAESDGNTWIESFSVGDTSYGHYSGGLPLIIKIFLAIGCSALVFLGLFAILGSILNSIQWIYWLYFILQGVFCIKEIIVALKK